MSNTQARGLVTHQVGGKGSSSSLLRYEGSEALLELINQALKATSSARRMALLFDQQSHWFAVLEPGYAARLQRVGVVAAPSVP